ncbi:MAG: patatin-like phospholipase family protein [Rhabdochlamydiaceae bacterium]|nr:patatin-like phospholipase family protein [Rhabdochlamydiaceae bacterium]
MSLQVYANTTVISGFVYPMLLAEAPKHNARLLPLIDPTLPRNRLLENHQGEIVLIGKPPAEVLGERILRPLIDRVYTVVSKAYAPFASMKWNFPSLLPGAYASPITDASSKNNMEDSCLPVVVYSETPITSLLAEAKKEPIGSSTALAKTDQLFDAILSSPNQLTHLNIADIIDLKDSRGYNLFFAAAEQGDQVAIESLLQHGELVHFTDGAGRTALHIAAQRGNAALIPQLARHISISSKDHQGFAPLHLAIHEQQPKAVEALLERGARLSEAWITPERTHVNPLSMAVVVGHAETLQVMIQHDVFKKVDLTQTVHGIGNLLHLAIHANQAPMLETLLTSEDVRKLMRQSDPQGRTPLQLAAYLGDLNAIYLLDRHGVYLNDGKEEGKATAVYYAADGEHADAIEFLYNLGADIEAANEEGYTPRVILKDRQSPEAKTCVARLDSLRGTQRIAVTRPPNFTRRPPHNLVFQGGGPRGLAYLGALRKLELLGAVKEVRRVAGTSAGAILSSLISVGYDSKALEPHLSKNFAELLDPQHTLERELLKTGKEQGLSASLRVLVKEYWEGWQTLKHPLKRAETYLQRLNQMTGLCSGEELRVWVDQLIQQATKSPENPNGIKHCTFEELHTLRRKNPTKFKDLHVFAIRITDEKAKEDIFGIMDSQKTEIVRFNYEDGGAWNRLIISDAVRASVSIPGAFKPHTLHFKDETGTRHPVEHHGKFFDGGLVRNYPIDAFDDEKYQEDPFVRGEKTNRRTLGLSLETAQETTPNIPESPKDIAQAMIYTFYHAEELLQREHPYHKDRTVSIPVKEVGLLDFDVSEEKKKEMIASGEQSVSFFLTHQESKI